MKKLEYRVWDIDRKKMIYSAKDNYFLLNQKGILFCNDGIELDNWNDKFIITLFIGRKDKKGKKIYDGDIIQFDSNEFGRKETCVINWNKNNCSFNPQDIEKNYRNGNYIHYWDQIENIEIIGHKFQSEYNV